MVCVLKPPNHLLHPFLSHVGVNLRGGDAFMTEQRLDVDPFRSGIEQIGRISMAQATLKSSALAA